MYVYHSLQPQILIEFRKIYSVPIFRDTQNIIHYLSVARNV